MTDVMKFLRENAGDWPKQRECILAADWSPIDPAQSANPETDGWYDGNTISDLRVAAMCDYITREQFAEVAPFVNAQIAAKAAQRDLPNDGA